MDVEKPLAERAGDTICQKDLFHYFKTNVWVTTAGHFSTEVLKFVNDYLGPSRILFSVDYPYETIPMGCAWWDGEKDSIVKALGSEKAYYDIGRENAKKLLRLGPYFQCNE